MQIIIHLILFISFTVCKMYFFFLPLVNIPSYVFLLFLIISTILFLKSIKSYNKNLWKKYIITMVLILFVFILAMVLNSFKLSAYVTFILLLLDIVLIYVLVYIYYSPLMEKISVVRNLSYVLALFVSLPILIDIMIIGLYILKINDYLVMKISYILTYTLSISYLIAWLIIFYCLYLFYKRNWFDKVKAILFSIPFLDFLYPYFLVKKGNKDN